MISECTFDICNAYSEVSRPPVNLMFTIVLNVNLKNIYLFYFKQITACLGCLHCIMYKEIKSKCLVRQCFLIKII